MGLYPVCLVEGPMNSPYMSSGPSSIEVVSCKCLSPDPKPVTQTSARPVTGDEQDCHEGKTLNPNPKPVLHVVEQLG